MRLTVIEGTAAPGEGPPLHVHRDQDETIYVLKGRYRVRLGERDVDAPAGAFVFIPRGTPHTWQNVGAEVARFVATLAPADVRFERFFRPLLGAHAGRARRRRVRADRARNPGHGGTGPATRCRDRDVAVLPGRYAQLPALHPRQLR